MINEPDEIDATRNPELESARAAWDAPTPTTGFHARVLSAYEREFGRPRARRQGVKWLIALPVAVALVAAILFFSGRGTRTDGSLYGYRPVQQPRFILISQGEHP